jgi:DNA-binding transcriptional ArsR family regulator
LAGWVKLWRKLKDNGHLKMPGTAFKLWIYCLLEAAPYPDRARGLEAGELWLNYEHIRQVIGEAGRQMSKSTVSSALKYLEQNGYLKLQAQKFYGVKARVANWQDYQSGTETVPAGTAPGTETVPVPVPDPVPVRGPEPYSGAACEAPKNIKNNIVVVVTWHKSGRKYIKYGEH